MLLVIPDRKFPRIHPRMSTDTRGSPGFGRRELGRSSQAREGLPWPKKEIQIITRARSDQVLETLGVFFCQVDKESYFLA